MSQDKLSDRLELTLKRVVHLAALMVKTRPSAATNLDLIGDEINDAIAEAEALERNRAEPVAHPDMTCGTCRRMLRWKDGQYHHHGPMMERHGVLVAEPWEEAGVVAAHPPKEAPAPTARVLTNEEIDRLKHMFFDGPEERGQNTLVAKYWFHKTCHYIRDNGYLSSPKPQVSVEEIMEATTDVLINHFGSDVLDWIERGCCTDKDSEITKNLSARLTKLMDR